MPKLGFPSNRQTPVDVELTFKSTQKHAPQMSAHFNWLEETGEIWTIAVETRRGTRLELERGGTVLKVDGRQTVANPSEEYEAIYERFARLLKKRKSEMDGSPLRLVADAFLLGARDNLPEFHW